MRIVTYHSVTADERLAWIAFIEDAGKYLPVRFNGRTEEAASAEAQKEWDRHEVDRVENIARREAGRIKAAETAARKKAGVA